MPPQSHRPNYNRYHIASYVDHRWHMHWQGQTTDAIPHDATAELLEYYLEKLSTTMSVNVSITGGNGGVCAGT